MSPEGSTVMRALDAMELRVQARAMQRRSSWIRVAEIIDAAVDAVESVTDALRERLAPLRRYRVTALLVAAAFGCVCFGAWVARAG